jgi:N-ethylmaleimide reductase
MDYLRPYFKNTLITTIEYTPEKAEKVLSEKRADLVSFGRAFIANPDFVERIGNGYPLAESDPKLWMCSGDKGYIDYPRYEE